MVVITVAFGGGVGAQVLHIMHSIPPSLSDMCTNYCVLAQKNLGFMGFTVMWSIVFLYFLFGAIGHNRLAVSQNRPFMWTSRLLPVYQYDPELHTLGVNYWYPVNIYCSFVCWYVRSDLTVFF